MCKYKIRGNTASALKPGTLAEIFLHNHVLNRHRLVSKPNGYPDVLSTRSYIFFSSTAVSSQL